MTREEAVIPRKVWVSVFVLALAFNLVAVWVPTWLPMGDLGGHIEMMDVVARATDSATVYPEFYVVRSPWTANGLSLVVAKALYPSVEPLMTARLLMSWYVVGLPLSIALLVWVFGRPMWLSLFSAPMVFNSIVNVGFINFLVALPLIFLSLAFARQVAVTRAVRWSVALAVTLVFLFYAHIIAFMMGTAMVLTVLILHMRRLKDTLSLGTVLPGLVPFGLWVYERIISPEGTAAGRTFVTRAGGLRPGFLPFKVRVVQMHQWGLRHFKDHSDEVLVAVLITAWLFAWVATRRQKTAERAEPASRRSRATLFVLALGCVAGYFILPNHLHEVSILAERAWLLALLLLVALPLPTAKVPSRLAFVVVSVAALVYPWSVTANYKRFSDKHVQELASQIESFAPRTGLMYIFDREIAQSDVTYMGALWHWPRAIHVTSNGGFGHDSFMRRPYGGPIDYRPGKLPTRHIRHLFKDDALFEFDYLLLLKAKPPKHALESDRVKLRWHSGHWWLFDVVKPVRGE